MEQERRFRNRDHKVFQSVFNSRCQFLQTRVNERGKRGSAPQAITLILVVVPRMADEWRY